MNIETKYLIRWGVPGWIFILIIASVIYLIFHPSINLKDVNLVDILGLLVSAGFIGVPIGYLFHQIYFSYNWLGKKRIFDEAVKLIDDQEKVRTQQWELDNHVDYFHFEHLWQRELIKLNEYQTLYLSERYRHFLTTIHGLGALWVALASSLIINCILFLYNFNHIDKISMLILIVIGALNGYLLFAVYKGFKYYSKNLNHFQGHFLNDFFNDEFKKINNDD